MTKPKKKNLTKPQELDFGLWLLKQISLANSLAYLQRQYEQLERRVLSLEKRASIQPPGRPRTQTPPPGPQPTA